MHSHFRMICLTIVVLAIIGLGQLCEPPPPPPPTECNLPTPPAGSFAIIDTSPCNNDVNVATNTSIRLTFNRSADPATLNGVLRPQIDATVQWSNSDTQVEIIFANALEANTTYTMMVISCMDTAGNQLWQPVTICFSTGGTLGACHQPLTCQNPDATDPNVPAYTAYNYSPLFASDSFWNTPIGTNPQIDANSDTMIARFAQVADQFGGLWLGVDADTVPIYFADASTPRYDVTLTASWAPVATRTAVPIPDHAIPDCGDDNFMCILDTVNNLFYEFWQVTKQTNGSWSGSWVSSPLDATGNGVFPGIYAEGTMGVRVSQFSLAAGMVWPHELAADKIEHALVFVYSFVRAGVYTSPAKGTDGAHNDPAAIPIGARLQLDPTLDLNGLGLSAYEQVIAKALQDYGMILSDSGGGIGLPAVHPYSFAGNPYNNLLPDTVMAEDGTLLSNIPADRFRVLQMTLQEAD